MRAVWSCAALAALCLTAPAARSAPVPKGAKTGKTIDVPYKLTGPKHIMVRAKINGKGPFNFILDTGAPALFVAVEAAKKAKLAADAQGWATIDRFEIEGGLVLPKARARVQTPFQLQGMNGMGLAGVEIHGLIGYNILAQYRMEIDFTRSKMGWTRLDYTPKAPLGMGGKGAGGQGGLEIFGKLMQTVGKFLGKKPAPPVTLRGFFGLTLANGDEYPEVRGVLAQGPAGVAGVQVGDRVTKVQGRTVTDVTDIIQTLRKAGKLVPGSRVTLTVARGKATREITFKIEEGI